jgi:hypothetical protein
MTTRTKVWVRDLATQLRPDGSEVGLDHRQYGGPGRPATGAMTSDECHFSTRDAGAGVVIKRAFAKLKQLELKRRFSCSACLRQDHYAPTIPMKVE